MDISLMKQKELRSRNLKSETERTQPQRPLIDTQEGRRNVLGGWIWLEIISIKMILETKPPLEANVVWTVMPLYKIRSTL